MRVTNRHEGRKGLESLEGTESSAETPVWSWNENSSLITQLSYHEMSDRPVVEMDELSQLKFQMKLLSDLQGRQSFLMREIRYLMKV